MSTEDCNFIKNFQQWFNQTYGFHVKEDGKFHIGFLKAATKAMEREIGTSPIGRWGENDKQNYIEVGLEGDNQTNKIKIVQALLSYHGYWSCEIDGVYDERLKETISIFQKDNNIAWSGDIGSLTIEKLLSKVHKRAEGEYEPCRKTEAGETISEEGNE